MRSAEHAPVIAPLRITSSRSFGNRTRSGWRTPDPACHSFPGKQRKEGNAEGSVPPDELPVGYAPGITPVTLNPGQAKLVKAGSDLVLQMHYTANGKTATDRSRIGVIFAKEKPAQRIFTPAAMDTKFVIPPGEANQRVDSALTIQEDTWLIDMMPHMHLRGKDFEYRPVFPTGEKQTILSVPKFDFNWQLFYTLEKPLLLPKGTRIECTAHFDNSPNNAANPDSKAEVRWGDQSWEEMMIGWFDIAIDPEKNPMDYLRKKKPVTSD